MEVETKKSHVFTLSDRKAGNISAVIEVCGYGEEELVLKCTLGRLVIRGKSLKIISFNASSGELSFTGEVSEVKYTAQKGPLFKRIFK